MNTELLFLLPLIIIGIGALTLMLLSTSDLLHLDVAAYTTMGTCGLAFVTQLFVHTGGTIPFSSIFNEMLVVNEFTRATGLIILACGLFTAMSCHTYFRDNPVVSTEFYSLLLFAICGMLLLTMTQELITLFIGLETMSLAIYVLVGYDRRRLTAVEALLKYLLLGAFAGAFFVMGSALIYAGIGSTHFAAISVFVENQGITSSPALVCGSLFILFALLFKVAAFPFHAWVMGVYEGAVMPVTGFMATALKTATFALLANFLLINTSLQSSWVTVLFYVIVLTMFAGNFIAIGQDSLKRMLAASGIVHSGYLLIALVAVNPTGFTGAVIAYYLAAYSASTLGMFAALSFLSGEDERRVRFDDFKGLAKTHPWSAAAITVFLLSMAGIPPTAGFFGKLYIIISAINAGQVALAVLAIVSSILSMWYYLRLIVNMYFRETEEIFEKPASSTLAPASTFILAVVVFAIALLPVTI
ncbi:MAG: NADH-quinone oxidoreductase subunit N [Desulfobulbus propionicus]|nr:MAG: NADH-quinone oxidoreductase subunit N [Desulfobulbus propionicus]